MLSGGHYRHAVAILAMVVSHNATHYCMHDHQCLVKRSVKIVSDQRLIKMLFRFNMQCLLVTYNT